MLKRFWKYQQLLSGSIGFGNVKKPSIPSFFVLFITLILLSIFTVIVGGGEIFYPIFVILCATYYIINSENRLFEIVPVSNIYVLVNIYLYVFIMSLAATIGGIIGLILTKLLLPFTIDLNISLFLSSWKSLLITGAIAIIITSILLPIFFIRFNFIRKTLTISVIALSVLALILFTNALELGKVNFLKNIAIIPHYNMILLILVCMCLVLIPTSFLISYRLYKGRRF